MKKLEQVDLVVDKAGPNADGSWSILGVRIVKGKTVTVRADVASLVERKVGASHVKILHGTPVPWVKPTRPDSSWDEAIRLPNGRPARAEPIPEALRKELAGKGGVAAVAEGKADERLQECYIWALLSGFDAVVAALATRVPKAEGPAKGD